MPRRPRGSWLLRQDLSADLSLGLRGRIGSLMLQFCAEREAGPLEDQSAELHGGQAGGSGCVPSSPARGSFRPACIFPSWHCLRECGGGAGGGGGAVETGVDRHNVIMGEIRVKPG